MLILNDCNCQASTVFSILPNAVLLYNKRLFFQSIFITQFWAFWIINCNNFYSDLKMPCFLYDHPLILSLYAAYNSFKEAFFFSFSAVRYCFHIFLASFRILFLFIGKHLVVQRSYTVPYQCPYPFLSIDWYYKAPSKTCS